MGNWGWINWAVSGLGIIVVAVVGYRAHILSKTATLDIQAKHDHDRMVANGEALRKELNAEIHSVRADGNVDRLGVLAAVQEVGHKVDLLRGTVDLLRGKVEDVASLPKQLEQLQSQMEEGSYGLAVALDSILVSLGRRPGFAEAAATVPAQARRAKTLAFANKVIWGEVESERPSEE